LKVLDLSAGVVVVGLYLALIVDVGNTKLSAFDLSHVLFKVDLPLSENLNSVEQSEFFDQLKDLGLSLLSR
jgi:hypothetical protein